MSSSLIAVSRLTIAEAHAAATAQVHALASPHPIQLRIQPVAARPSTAAQIVIKAQVYKDWLAAGTYRIVKASAPNDGSELAGVAVWVLFDGKKAQLEDGVVPAPPRKRTKEDEEALVGVDVEIRRRFGEISSETRDSFMGGSRYWCVQLESIPNRFNFRRNHL